MILRELYLKFSDSSEDLALVRPDNLGKRSKLGGKPTWIQQEDFQNCPHCGKPMVFIMQLDSIDYDKHPEKEYMFGDVGMIYTFFCFDCLQVSSVFQCY